MDHNSNVDINHAYQKVTKRANLLQSPPSVREALQKRVEHGVFGYGRVEDHYYEALFQWQKKRVFTSAAGIVFLVNYIVVCVTSLVNRIGAILCENILIQT